MCLGPVLCQPDQWQNNKISSDVTMSLPNISCSIFWSSDPDGYTDLNSWDYPPLQIEQVPQLQLSVATVRHTYSHLPSAVEGFLLKDQQVSMHQACWNNTENEYFLALSFHSVGGLKSLLLMQLFH